MGILRRHAFSAWPGGSGLSSLQFYPVRKRLLDMGVLGRGKAAPAGLRTEGAGVGRPRMAGQLARCAELEGATTRAQLGLAWPRRGKETVAPVLSRRAPARDRARLPFCGVAAISRRRGGRTMGEGRTLPAEVWGRGGGRARAPRPAHRRARPLCSWPLGWTAARPGGELVEPRKSRREARTQPRSPLSSTPSQKWDLPAPPWLCERNTFCGGGLGTPPWEAGMSP